MPGEHQAGDGRWLVGPWGLYQRGARKKNIRERVSSRRGKIVRWHLISPRILRANEINYRRAVGSLSLSISLSPFSVSLPPSLPPSLSLSLCLDFAQKESEEQSACYRKRKKKNRDKQSHMPFDGKYTRRTNFTRDSLIVRGVAPPSSCSICDTQRGI